MTPSEISSRHAVALEWLEQRNRVVVASLVETVGSYAAAITAGPDAKVVGIELNASYHRSATSGEVTATCTPAGSDDDLPVRTFAIDVRDDQDRLTSTARLTCMVLSGRD